MVEGSKIEWTDHTFNPWIGCQKVAPECDHCYAEAQNLRWHNGANWGPKAPPKAHRVRILARTASMERRSRRLRGRARSAAEGVLRVSRRCVRQRRALRMAV